MGIRSKMVLIIGALGLLGIGMMGYFSYRFSKEMAIEEAKSKSRLVLNYVHSTRKYLKNVQRPLVMELIEKERFYPELMSGFVVARGTYDIFKSQLPEYQFKQATLDPLYPDNRADSDEAALISTFHSQSSLNQHEGTISKDGELFYYIAEPIRIDDQKCLKCHGNPQDAPKDQIEIYGSTNGYNWKMGDTVAAFMVYVPIQKALDAAFDSSRRLAFIGGGSILIAMLAIWFFLDNRVVGPIRRLNQRAHEISLGQDLDKIVEVTSRDEIGSLSESIERLRASIEIAIQRRRR